MIMERQINVEVMQGDGLDSDIASLPFWREWAKQRRV